MNHSKTKNYNRTAAARKAMFKNMVTDFNKRGHITTTVAKAKRLKQILQSETDEKIKTARVGFRKGDNAEMMKVFSESYLEKKFSYKPENKKGKDAKTN